MRDRLENRRVNIAFFCRVDVGCHLFYDHFLSRKVITFRKYSGTARGEKIPLLIKTRDLPLHLEPISGLENCVTDEQILKALHASLPLWRPPSVPSLVHELKLWGKDCDFTQDQVGGEGRTGKMMVETLLNDSLCAERTVKLGEENGGTYLLDS
ncbi:MAG: hypothetical protein LBT05_02035, partial [Planctomycetaceae bacterium]|nr:hypothetical protein [Planctomycetaceae bacterium]